VGALYTINPADAAATKIGPIRIDGKFSIGVTGLAFHPTTGVLYGITAGSRRTCRIRSSRSTRPRPKPR
jgi:hypothetical protein